MTLEDRPFRFQLGVGVLVFIGFMIIGYLSALFGLARVNNSVTTTTIAWAAPSGLVAFNFVWHNAKIPPRVRTAWVHLKYTAYIIMFAALVVLVLLYPPAMPFPFGLAELIISIGFIAIVIVPWLVSGWRKELAWWALARTSPEATESSVNSTQGVIAASSQVDKTLAVFQRKLEQPKSSGPQMPAAYHKRDGYKVIAYGGKQPDTRRLRRR